MIIGTSCSARDPSTWATTVSKIFESGTRVSETLYPPFSTEVNTAASPPLLRVDSRLKTTGASLIGRTPNERTLEIDVRWLEDVVSRWVVS